MTWRFNLSFEFGKVHDEPPEREGGADSLTERAGEWRPIGFYPASDPTRRPDDLED